MAEEIREDLGILTQEYIPTQWMDNAAPAINAANLNHIEQGIKSATDGLIQAESDIIQLRQDVDQIENDPYILPGATPGQLGGIRVSVVNNGDGTYTGYIWTTE